MEVMRKSIYHFALSLVVVFLLLAFSFLLLPKDTFAQTTSFNSTTLQSSYISPQSPHSASLAIYNFSHAVSCILIGQSPIAPCLEYKLSQNTRGTISSTPYLSSVNTNNGVFGVGVSMVATLLDTPPIRSSEFIADFGEQIGIKSANAQVGGSGNQVLSPIFKLWEVSRNIAYLVMILIFVLVGLMVMFRQKLNPQTVVSIQMALPGLVVGLVMITFSYFLAALISDVAFIGTNLVGYYFSLAQDGSAPTQLPLVTSSTPGTYNPRPDSEDNVLSIFGRYVNIINTFNVHPPLAAIWPYLEGKDNVSPEVLNLSTSILSAAPGGSAAAQIGDFILNFDAQKAIQTLVTMLAVQFVLPFGGLFGGPGQAIAGGGAALVAAIAPLWLVSWSLAFVAMLVLIYSMFKLLLRLINNFLSIIFLTITAPFFFLAASIPGKQGIATTWMFNMLCNVLAFPAIFAVFYFVAFILGNNQDPLFAVREGTTITGRTVFPLLGGINLRFLNILVAFGALAASPSIPDIICRSVGKPSALGGVAAGAISGAISSGQRYQGQIQSGTSGFAGNMGRLSDSTEYHIKGLDKEGKPIYDVDRYRSHAGQVAKIGQWVNRNFRASQVVSHERAVINPNRPSTH